jgi:hypothetical protein
MYGLLSDVQLAGQSSFGTLNVSSLRTVPVTKESLALSIAQQLDPAMYGRFGESPRYSGKRDPAGALDFVPLPTFFGTLLYAACGRDSVTSGAGIQTHKFRPLDVADWDANIALPPFSILVNRDVGSAALYYDMAANELNLDVANGELVKGSIGWIGGKYADNAKVAAVFPAAEKEWTWDTFSASYGGQPLNMRKFSLKLLNDLEAIFWLGNSVYPALIKRKGAVKVSGQFTLQFQTYSHFYDFSVQSQPGRQLLLNFLSTVASPSLLKLDLPQTRLMKYAPAIAGPGVLDVAVDYVGEYNVGSSYQLEWTLTNTQAQYP